MGTQKYIGGVNFDELRAQRVQVYNTLTLDLATARNNKELPYTGNYLYVLEATDILANVQLRFNEISMNSITVTKGRGVRVPFYRLYITNSAQAGKSMTLGIAVESETFEVLDVGKALEISGNISIAGAGGTPAWGQISIVDPPTDPVLDANPDRRRAIIQNIDATGVLWLGYSNSPTLSATTAGHILDPHEHIVLETTSQIWGRLSGATGSRIAYLEENN